MSGEIEDDEEGATQMMTSRSLVGDAGPDALDEEEGDLTVPFDRGKAFAQFARPRPAAGAPATPRQAPLPQQGRSPQQGPSPQQGFSPQQAPFQPGAPGRPPFAQQAPSPQQAPFQPGAPGRPPFAQQAPSPPVRPRSNEPTTPQRKIPVEPPPESVEPDLTTGSITVPVVRDDLPLPSLSDLGDTGEMTVPRGLAPKAPEPRQVPRYDLPPPAYKPPPVQPLNARQASRPGSVPPPAAYTAPQAQPRPGSIPPGYIQSTGAPIPALAQAPTPPPQPHGLAQMATPPPQGYGLSQMATPPPQAHGLSQMATPPPQGHGLSQMATPPPQAPQGPMSAPVPSAEAPSKMRSPPVFVAVMVACTVLTVTGLLLLVYLKFKHFW